MRKWTPVGGGSGSGSKAAGELVFVVHGVIHNFFRVGAPPTSIKALPRVACPLFQRLECGSARRPLASSASFDTYL